MATKTEPSGVFGCLFVILFVVGGTIFMQNANRHQVENSKDVIDATRKVSHTYDNDTFFTAMTTSWKELRGVGGIFFTGAPTVEKLPSGHFSIVIQSGIASLAEGADLGISARKDALDFIVATLTMSEGKRTYIDAIRVVLTASDNGQTASYVSEFHPSSVFTDSTTLYSDSDLNHIVDRNLDVMLDTASGYHWVIKYGR